MRDLVNYLRLNEREIRNHIGDARIYHRGRMYFFNKFVGDIQFDEIKGYISATVRGTHNYTVKLFTNSNNDIYAENCTCAYYKEMRKPCKHIAAALFELNRVAENQAIKYKNSYRAVNAIFNRMDSEKEVYLRGKEQIHLYPTLHVSKNSSTIDVYLELKTGVDAHMLLKAWMSF